MQKHLTAPNGVQAVQRILGQNVRRLRQARGMTRAALAAAAGVSAGNLSVIESGRGNPRATTLAAIAAALEVNATILLVEGPSDLSA